MEIAYSCILSYAMYARLADVDEITLPSLVGSLGIAYFALYNYASAKK